uniref:Uncharacterized protein n=1 Tax=Oryza brachyantha TaxID=4533 RepID=J3L1E5_ORYBR
MATRAWNYVVTAHKPTVVAPGCVGCFTAPDHLNPRRLLMLDVPAYGRIAAIYLFHPCDEAQDSLFICMERYRYCVLHWDGRKSASYKDNQYIICRSEGDAYNYIGRHTDKGQIGANDAHCRLIGLHIYDGMFKASYLYELFFVEFAMRLLQVIPFGSKGHLDYPFDIRTTMVQDMLRHMKLHCRMMDLFKSIIESVGQVDADGSRYLFGNNSGGLHLLVVTHEQGSAYKDGSIRTVRNGVEISEQVTAKYFSLVSSSSKELLAQWVAPEGFSVNVASANASQRYAPHVTLLPKNNWFIEIMEAAPFSSAYVLPEETELTKQEESLIKEVARDYNTTWMTAVEMLDNDVYIGADNCYNLFTMLKPNDADKALTGGFLVIGQYHLGDYVHRCGPGLLDGDLIESFLGLEPSKMEEVAMMMWLDTDGPSKDSVKAPRKLHYHDHRIEGS